MCNQLEQPLDDVEEEEKGLSRKACIKAFLLLLVVLTFFASKKSRNVHLIWMTALQDLDTFGK